LHQQIKYVLLLESSTKDICYIYKEYVSIAWEPSDIEVFHMQIVLSLFPSP